MTPEENGHLPLNKLGNMSMQISIEVKGDREVLRKLNRLGIDVTNFRDELSEVGQDLVDLYSGKVFDSQGSEIGKKWAPLSEKYRKYKQRRWPGAGPLEASGKMRGSFAFQNNQHMLEVRNKVDYFKYHQLGTKDIPQRRMMRLDDKRKKEVVETLKLGLFKRIQRIWR